MGELALEEVNVHLDTVVLAALPDGRFELLGLAPPWFERFLPAADPSLPFRLDETFAFFETFLIEVREVLAADPAAQVNSGPWAERDADHEFRNLSAVAFCLSGRIVVQLKAIGEAQLYHQAVFQKAREYSLNYEMLVKERDRKEVVLHSIVHDLAGPLTAISGSLELLGLGTDGPDSELVKMALQQCETERTMIISLLETFASEYAPFDGGEVRLSNAPDVLKLLRYSIGAFGPAFKNRQVDLALEYDGPPDEPVLVVAEQDGLVRVLSNLIDNALRYSPPHTQTSVRLEVDEEWVTVTVSDRGPGVLPETRSTLFGRWQGGHRQDGHEQGGKIGLGLYFCRITVERWGGSIGHEPHPAVLDEAEGREVAPLTSGIAGPGARFWFRLPRLIED